MSKRLLDGLDTTMEKMRDDPLRLARWFAVLIWIGIGLLLYALDKVDSPQEGWAILAWGGGAVALLETLLRLIVPRWRAPVVYSAAWGAVWIGVGFCLWYDSWDALGPIGIIGLGLVLLGGVIAWQRKSGGSTLEEAVKRVKKSPVRFVAVAVLVIWFGISLLLMATDTILGYDTAAPGDEISASQRGWAVFALGGAIIFFVETLVRLGVSRWRPPFVYSLIWALVWLAAGLSLWFSNMTVLAPIVFIGLGVVLLGLLLPRPPKEA